MHEEPAVLLRETVVSMVPAAPLLPAMTPLRADVAHWASPADVVGGAVDEVTVVDEWRVEVDVEVEAAAVVVVEDEFDEQAPRRHPPTTSAATSPPLRSLTTTPLLAGRCRHRGWRITPYRTAPW
jgi:hypothetical protein